MNEFTIGELSLKCHKIIDELGRAAVAEALSISVQAVGKVIWAYPGSSPFKYYDLKIRIMALGGYDSPVIKISFKKASK